MFKVKKALSVLLRPLVRAMNNQRELDRLAASGAPYAKEVAQALRETLDDSLEGREKETIAQIEAMREALLASTEPIETMDYGAGSSSDNRSEEEMLQGVAGRSTIGTICQSASKKGVWSTLLFKFVRHCKPKTCLEMGTSLGLSCSYKASALELNGEGGRIVSLEGSENIANQARKNLAALGLDNAEVRTGRFADTLEATLKDIGPVDYAFIDGHHEHKATLDYFDQICPHLAENAVLVFDDVYWTPGMLEAWQKIAADPRVVYSVNLYRLGVCVVGKNAAGKPAQYSVAIN